MKQPKKEHIGSKNLVQFKKGERPVGRQKGSKNKLGVKLKDAIMQAAELSGQDGKGKNGATGYLVWLSRAEPAVFGRMLEKLLPLQLDVKDKTNVQLTPAEAVDQLKERGLPIPPSLLHLTATQVGEAVAMRREQDDDDELNHLEDEPESNENDEDRE
jgi:hypothetical protein